MSLVEAYLAAQQDERLARIRRSVALRAMAVSGQSQRQIAEALGVSQSAVSQQLAATPVTDDLDSLTLMAAARPVVRALAESHGFSRVAVFGSVGRGDARPDSDVDLLVESPQGMSTFELLRFQHLLEEVLGRHVDVVDYGGLTPGLDDDVLREAVPL